MPMLQKNQRMILSIDSLGVNGEGVAKVEGFPVFVKGALQGERCECVITKVCKSFAYARLLVVLERSAKRCEPRCTVSGKCGGCVLQHLEYGAQLEYKREKVRQNLIRIGHLEESSFEVMPTVGMDEPYFYRNKAQYPVGEGKDGIEIGFYAVNSHRIVESDICCIGSKKNTDIIKRFRAFMLKYGISAYNEETGKGCIRHLLIRESSLDFEIMLCPVINGKNFKYKAELAEEFKDIKSIYVNYNTARTNVILGDRIEAIKGENEFTDKIGELKFRISPFSFFQVNPIQTEKLYNIALSFAELNKTQTVVDAYCGIGTISLFIAKKAKEVHGIEIVPQAIDDANYNKKLNKIENATFYCGRSETIVPKLCQTSRPDVIFVDPPRKGCDKALLDTIINTGIEKTVYISCDSSTLARDVAYLTQNGYKVEKVVPVDMFPHTGHVETVVLMSRKG